MTVADELKIWEQILLGVGVRHHLLILMFSAFVWTYPAFILCTGTRALFSADVPSALQSVCGVFAMYSSGAAAFLLAFRRRQILDVVTQARRVVLAAERGLGSELTESIGSWMSRIRQNGFTYIKVGSAMATLEQFMSNAPAIPPCIQFESVVGRLVVATVESIKWSCMATYFFSVWLLILALLMAMEAQYKLLCFRLSKAKGFDAIRACAVHLKEVLELESGLYDLFYSALLHMLAGALLVPLINTYQLLFGPRTMFSVLTLSTLPLVYGSISILGDRLATGRDKVGEAVYGGPWMARPAKHAGSDADHARAAVAARICLMLMQSCSRREPFAMKGLGSFTRASSYRVLRAWYQYLNLLISTVT